MPGSSVQAVIGRVELGRRSRKAGLHARRKPPKLGEIVVTGAGTVSEAEKIGTGQSSVDSTAIVQSNEPNVVNALAAKAPNVTVTSSSGDPGASSFIQIRGQTTITAADGQPLIVVDGVPIDNSINYNNPLSGALNSAPLRPTGHSTSTRTTSQTWRS